MKRLPRYFRWIGLAVAASCWGASPAAAQQATPSASDLFVLCATYCGVVDGTGKRVMDRVFEKLDDFEGDFARYEHDGQNGVVDRSGRTVIKPVHHWLQVVGDGLLLTEDKIVKGDDETFLSILHDAQGKELLRVENANFSSWRGHLFYRIGCHDKGAECRNVFLDGRGQPVAQFGAFRDDGNQPWTIASPDGKHFGFVDETLHFMVPPDYLEVEPFHRGVARVRTEAGPGLIDRRGRFVVPPGRYESLYPWDETPLIDAFRADDPNCGHYLRQDGKELHLPRGICPEAADDLESLGYAYVRDDQRRIGIMDAHGKVLVRPTFPYLRGINADYLLFGDNAVEPKRFGVVDRRGRVVLPLQSARIQPFTESCCSNPGVLHDVFLGIEGGQYGMLSHDGHWIIPARYTDAVVISPDLVALSDKDGVYHFFSTNTGQPIGLTSASAPYSYDRDATGRFERFSFTREMEVRTDNGGTATIKLKGVADKSGRIVVPADYKDIEDIGNGLFKVKKQEGYLERIGVLDRTGKVIIKPQYSDMSRPFINGAAVFSTGDGDAVLIDTTGKVLASFNTLFPDLADRGGNEPAERDLDICFDPDPTAEPEDKPSLAPAARHICGDPALRKQSRETEKTRFAAQAGDCLPDVFLALRPAYDHALSDCTDASCVSDTMQAFRRNIADTARRCAARPDGLILLKQPVAARLRARLTRKILAVGDDDFADDDEGKASIQFQNMLLGQRRAVLAIGNTGAHNGPIWLFAQDRRGGWETLLEGSAGYLRPLEATHAFRNGLPVLRTQEHVSCCEHAVTFYAYDGKTYKLMHECTQLYDADETPLLFCNDGQDAGQ